ncbi:hypothetical protein XELAEV_18006723mg [Xenopus laevis]|uniref:Uncharacterized protein n=1 Tax=Xenopus laevis TaxID=8355 RepID=A0A974DZT2_XENLA|nr:hypothetical protein XELAEV_18006723mg [Xenopus laevis]
MVLGTTHKRHMIPAPPAVSSVPNTDAPQSRHQILKKQQPCIPFHSIPQTANAWGLQAARSPMEWKGMQHSLCVLNVPCLCCHIPFSFSSFHLGPLNYHIHPPPPLPLIQCGALIVGANPIAFKGSGRNFFL